MPTPQQSKPKAKFGKLDSSSPLGMLSELTGAFQQAQAFNPQEKITKDVTKALSEHYTNQAVQAAQSGVPASSILSTLNQMVGGSVAMAAEPPPGQGQQAPGSAQPQSPQTPPATPPAALAQAALGAQIQQPPTPVVPRTQPPITPAPGPFAQAKLLPGGGVQQQGFFGSLFAPSATDLLAQQGQAIANQQGMQKIAGEEPLQQGEREKLGLETERAFGVAKINQTADNAKFDTERRDKFFAALDAPVATESSQKQGQIFAANDAITQLTDIINTNPNALKSPNWITSPFGQKLRVLTEQLEQSLLRKESGATLTKDERKFIKSLTVRTGFSAWKESPSTALFKLSQIQKRLQLEQGILDPNSKLRTQTRALREAGYSNDQIWEYLKAKGTA